MTSKNYLINTNNWVIVDGILVPKWSVKIVEQTSDLDRDVIAYSTFEELYPNVSNSEEIIVKDFQKYWMNDIVQIIAKLHYIASFVYYKPNSDELKIMLEFIDDTALSNAMKYKGKRKYLSRQQMLANLRLAFMYASTDNSKQKVYGNEKSFGELLYRITDYLDGVDTTKEEMEKNQEARKKLYLNMARNLVFNETATFILALTRYWYIFNKIAARKKYKKIRLLSMFRKAAGVDFNYLLAIGFAIWGFYSETEKMKRISEPHEFLFSTGYFRETTPTSQHKLKKGLNSLSGTFDYYSRQFNAQHTKLGRHFAFNPFWEKPLIQVENEPYFILDTHYLEERVTNGAFWFIFGKAKNDSERGNLKGKWGNLFEEYIN